MTIALPTTAGTTESTVVFTSSVTAGGSRNASRDPAASPRDRKRENSVHGYSRSADTERTSARTWPNADLISLSGRHPRPSGCALPRQASTGLDLLSLTRPLTPRPMMMRGVWSRGLRTSGIDRATTSTARWLEAGRRTGTRREWRAQTTKEARGTLGAVTDRTQDSRRGGHA